MNLREQGRIRGRAAGLQRAATLRQEMRKSFRWLADLFPTTRGLDVPALLRDYDRERLACEPDTSRFPELRGLGDRHIGEREGFREATGADDVAVAFHFSWNFFVWRRINARHVAYYETMPLREQCTNVFLPGGAEGVTIADNRDVSVIGPLRRMLASWNPGPLPRRNKPAFWQGSVSSGILLDEEPECSFPCDPFELMPREGLEDIGVAMEFMTRYREFWGPGNMIWCDRRGNAVAVEKTNCRVAFRRPSVAGAVCVTAGSYLDPAIYAFKRRCLTKVLKAKRESPESNADWQYDLGCRARYRRLVRLTEQEASRAGGATLWGAFAIVADESVPFPARICLAGQKVLPERPGREMLVNWTVSQHAGVITGPRRRWLYRAIRGAAHPRPITCFPPRLRLGDGVRMRDEWLADVRAGRCVLDVEKED